MKIYEKHPHADAYRVHAEFEPYAINAKDKRFTDGELAAEYWRKAGDYDACTDGYSTATDGYQYENEKEEGERMMTLHRFGSRPHFDEVDQ